MNTNKPAKLATKILEWQAQRTGKAEIFCMDAEHLTSEFVFHTYCATSKYRFIAWFKFVKNLRSLLKGNRIIKWEGEPPKQEYNLIWREKPQVELVDTARKMEEKDEVWWCFARLCVKDKGCKIPSSAKRD